MRKVDHGQTEKALDTITSRLHAQVGILEDYLKEKNNGDNAKYSAGYLQQLADERMDNLAKKSAETDAIFMDAIASARECEDANSKAIDFSDPVLMGMLAAIDTLPDGSALMDNGGFNVAGNIIDAIVNELRGQRNALELVKNKLEGKGIQIGKAWNDYYYGADLFDNLELQLHGLATAPQAANYYINAISELRKIAKVLGITLRESDLDMGDMGGYLWTETMRQAAGA